MLVTVQAWPETTGICSREESLSTVLEMLITERMLRMKEEISAPNTITCLSDADPDHLIPGGHAP